MSRLKFGTTGFWLIVVIQSQAHDNRAVANKMTLQSVQWRLAKPTKDFT